MKRPKNKKNQLDPIEKAFIRLKKILRLADEGKPVVKRPNKITEKTFKDTDQSKNLTYHKNAKDMFSKIGIQKKNKSKK